MPDNTQGNVIQAHPPTTTRDTSKAVARLELMLDRLAAQLEVRQRERKSDQLERADYAAVAAGIGALLLHRVALSPATSPALVLRELLDALEAGDQSEVQALVTRAQHILDRLRT